MKLKQVLNTRTLLLPSLALNVALLVGLVHLDRQYDALAKDALESPARVVFTDAPGDELDSLADLGSPDADGTPATQSPPAP